MACDCRMLEWDACPASDRALYLLGRPVGESHKTLWRGTCAIVRGHSPANGPVVAFVAFMETGQDSTGMGISQSGRPGDSSTWRGTQLPDRTHRPYRLPGGDLGWSAARL